MKKEFKSKISSHDYVLVGLVISPAVLFPELSILLRRHLYCFSFRCFLRGLSHFDGDDFEAGVEQLWYVYVVGQIRELHYFVQLHGLEECHFPCLILQSCLRLILLEQLFDCQDSGLGQKSSR